MHLSILGVLLAQRKPRGPLVTADLTGKTVIVTGANVGVGYEAAKHFAEMNAGRLIIACRNEAKGKAAISKIEAETGYKNAELWLLDLANFNSVKEFADKFEKDGGRLDILLANAGVNETKYFTTVDGWESTLQINDLATFLLSILLLPHLIRTAQEFSTTPRLSIVASDVHYFADIPQAALDSPNVFRTLSDKQHCETHGMRRRYPESKLIDVFLMRALNDHLPKTTPVIVNAVNPGLCVTELARKEPHGMLFGAVRAVFEWLLASTAEEGSREYVYACVGGQGEEQKLRGAFIWFQQPTEVADYVLSPQGQEIQDRLWKELLEILGEISPKVPEIVREHLAP